mmetsp:Transcript_15178/g.44376  ORF Transcript_15178/g.44376 Transcript_15178/m.44376 type:complete len:221 (+) Transcript_15178:48-710(+)
MGDQSASYQATKRTALTFKGEDNKHKKKRRQQKSHDVPGQPKEEEPEGEQEGKAKEVPIIEGSGRIVTSTTTVHGFETKFKDELEAGDTIMFQHPNSLEVEKRVVISVLSQRSVVLHQAFSKDVVSTSEFHIRKDSLKLQERAKASIEDAGDTEALQDATSQELQRELERRLKKQRKQCTVREKTGMWGYKMVTTALSKEASTEQLLDERCKQGRDKYCF